MSLVGYTKAGSDLAISSAIGLEQVRANGAYAPKTSAYTFSDVDNGDGTGTLTLTPLGGDSVTDNKDGTDTLDEGSA